MVPTTTDFPFISMAPLIRSHFCYTIVTGFLLRFSKDIVLLVSNLAQYVTAFFFTTRPGYHAHSLTVHSFIMDRQTTIYSIPSLRYLYLDC